MSSTTAQRKPAAATAGPARAILACVLLFLGGALLGALASRLATREGRPAPELPLETRAKGYEFVSPLVECREFRPLGLVRTGLREDVAAYLAARQATGAHEMASVYFRDLNNGPWFGIEENAAFSPASLLKVAIMIGYFKRAQLEPSLLAKEHVVLQSPELPDEGIPREQKLVHGKPYPAQLLIERMITLSDNDAMATLVAGDPTGAVNRVLNLVGLPTFNADTRDEYRVRVRDYGGLFRVLYNASVLNEDFSNRALAVLSRTAYTRGLAAGVPPGTTVAHKYGLRRKAETYQLHDCGIVYRPELPYVLCVMTQGSDVERLTETVAGISRRVYDGIGTLREAGGQPAAAGNHNHP